MDEDSRLKELKVLDYELSTCESNVCVFKMQFINYFNHFN